MYKSIKLDHPYPHNSGAQYIFEDQNMGYSKSYQLLTVGFTGFPLDGEKGNWYATALMLMDRPHAMRMGAGVTSLVNSLEKLGCPCEVKQLGKELPDEYKEYPIVKGISGNY